jgi:hypothetical protein
MDGEGWMTGGQQPVDDQAGGATHPPRPPHPHARLQVVSGAATG